MENISVDRFWELTCDHCNGCGRVIIQRQVAERKTDVQEFKEECECCEGRGFTIAFEDIPGIEAYVKSCRPAADAPLTSMARAIFGDQIGGQMDAMAGTPAPSAPGDAQDERQAFEAWGLKGCEMVDDPRSMRMDIAQHCAWEAWQARGRLSAPAAGDALERSEMFRHQLAYERAKNERLIAILVGIHGLTLPAPIQVDGTTYVFTPPEAVEILRGLSDRIRAIPDEIAAALAAQVPQQGES